MSSVTTSNASILLVLLNAFLLLCDTMAEWVETAKVTDSDGQSGDYFGNAVAIDNGTLVVGARLDDIEGAISAGSMSIFERVEGDWVGQQKLTASDAGTNDWFGWSVAIYNGIVAVGAHLEDDGGFNAGAVYIYGKGGDGLWTERQKLIPLDLSQYDQFGNSLAIQGNTLVVGAPRYDSNKGSAFVYMFLNGIWTQAAMLTARDGSSEDGFGNALAIDADTLVVGARFDDDMGIDSGSAFVFRRVDEGGSWTQVAKFTPDDGQRGDLFGHTVAVEGDTVWVGSRNNVDGERVGAVYQFGEEGGTWIQQNKLVARDSAPGDNFGSGLALRHGTLVIGAYGEDGFTGAVYVFQEVSDDVWTQSAKLVGSDGTADDRFSRSVTVEDGWVVAGAYGDDSDRGSVYVFDWRVPLARPSVVPIPTIQPSPPPSLQPSSVESGMPTSQPTGRPAVATSVTPTSHPSRFPSEQPAAPVSTQSSGLQPIVIVVFVGAVGIAFLAGGGVVWILSRRNTAPSVPIQDTPHNEDRVVFTDDVSELEEPSLGKGVLSVESSAVSMVNSLGVGTASIGHSQQTSVP